MGCRIVLVSTPRILEPLEFSPELARRMREVFFPRYVFSQDMRSEDCKAFLSVVQAFVKELPEAMRPKLSSRAIQRL